LCNSFAQNTQKSKSIQVIEVSIKNPKKEEKQISKHEILKQVING